MLKGQVVVVTGGAGLLGASFCRTIANEGGISIVADVDIDQAEQLAQEIRLHGKPAQAVHMDVTDGDQIDRVIADVEAMFGQVDAVVNSAYPRSKNYGGSLEEVKYEDFCEGLSLHLGGFFLVSQRFALAFKTYGRGNIVNIGSIYGLFAPRFETYAGTAMTVPVEYAAIKAGVINLTRYFAQYFRKDGIRCNVLAPGGIRKNQPETFVRRYDAMCGSRGMLETTDVTGSLTFLLSEASKYITGQVIVVDDGWSL